MFLTPGAKLAQKVDVNSSLYNAIADSRGEPAAARNITACRTFQRLRAALHEPPTTEATRLAVKNYLSALNFITQTCKIPSTLSVGLLWVNAFDGNDHCVVHDLAIDHLCALFNLGVCEATLAVNTFRTRRTDPNAMTDSLKHFQMAAGYFHAASKLPSPGGVRSVTCDLYPPALRALEMVMLGNAQQVLYEITLERGNASAILARFAVGARDFYYIAQDYGKEPDVVNTPVNGYVGRPAGALAAYFDVVAQSAQANAAVERPEHYDMSQQLARLANAQASLTVSLNTVTALDTSSLAAVNTLRNNLIAELQNLQKDLSQRRETAEDENRKVFFASPATHVPEIVGRQSVRPADVSTVATEQPVDERLLTLEDLPDPVSPELSGVASRYADMVATMVADEVAAVSATSANLQSLIRQVEASITLARGAAAEAASRPTEIPTSSLGEEQKAIDCVREAQEKGGLVTLRELQSQVLKLGTETKFQIQEIDKVLQQEDAEDRQLRAQVYVTRPSSAVISRRYVDQLTAIRSNLEQAANADKIVSHQIDQHASAISLVTSINVVGFLPPSAIESGTKAAEEPQRIEAIISEIHPVINNAKKLLAVKDDIIEDFEKKRQLDNVYALTQSIEPGDAEIEKCNAIMEHEYGKLRERAKLSSEEMGRISQFMSDAEVRLNTKAPTSDNASDTQAKMNEVYKHQAAALKFTELMGHLQQGVHFYSKEQDVVGGLKRDIDGFVAARRTEAQQLLSQSTSGASGGAGGLYASPGTLYPGGQAQHPPGTYPPNAPYGAQPPQTGAHRAFKRL